jgi:hypothetical protein
MSVFYQPQYKQRPPLYTNGGELILRRTLEDYVGFYTQLDDGNYYSYYELSANTSEPLILKPTPMKIDSNTNGYYRLKRLDLANKKYPEYHIPSITADDIAKGYIVRYVAQKVNEPNVMIEISKDQFISNTNLQVLRNQHGIDTNLWIMHNINWTIVGEYTDIIKNNRKVLSKAEQYVSGISKYFTDLAEYIQVPTTGPDRIYTDGDAVPMSLPTSYQIRTSNQVPLGQACANCIFRFGNNCRKWEAEVRNNHWCRAWKLGNQ